MSEEKKEAGEKIQRGQFYVYECKVCQALVQDVILHTTQERHTKGYVAIPVPVDVVITEEQVKEQTEQEKKEVEKTAKATVAKLSK